MPRINYLAVLAAAAAYFMLGALWYSPLLFANKFIALLNWTPERIAQVQQQSHAKEFVLTFLGLVIMAYILAHFIHYTKALTALEGIVTAAWLWLGFVVVTNLNTVTFEYRPMGLYLINIGYHLVGMLIMGAILAVWRVKEP